MSAESIELQTHKIGELFVAKGYRRAALPVLQPADVFLDRLGDDVRSKIYVFTDPGGAEICLRPELTIPACRHYLSSAQAGTPMRLSYDGPVYRYAPLDSSEPQETHQIGVENFGAQDRDAVDCELVALCLDALKAAGAKDYRVTFGDTALFGALLETIALPPQWRGRLLRHFARAQDFKKLLSKPSDGQAPSERKALLSALGQLSEEDARAVVSDVLKLADIQPVGGRSLGEIAERFLEQAADASALKLGEETVALIEAFLAIDAEPAAALGALKDLCGRGKLNLSASIERLERHFSRLASTNVDLSSTRFATGFGRAMDYYSGFVFQVDSGAALLAAGGRYDRLLQTLGAPHAVPAAGFAIFSEALLYNGGKS